MKKQAIIKGTIILSVASLITRMFGFINRIYLSNLIGAEGMGLYQLIFPIYMICYTICCSGLFTAVSRLTAEESGKSNSNIQKPFIIVTTISTFLSIILMILLYFNAEFISMRLIHEPRITLGVKILSFTLPFTAITHCIKGYYYGLNKPTIPAITQVIEQIVRISTIYFISTFFLIKGLDYACAMAVIGMALGEIISCLLLIFSYRFNRKKFKINTCRKNYRFFIKKVSSISFPITSNRLITTLLTSIETILIPSELQRYGYSHSYAISIYGTLTGMALPLIFFPTIITNSASLMLLPAIADANVRNNKSLIKLTVTKTLKFSIIMGIAATFLFLAFGKDLGTIIYNEEYVGTLLVTLGWLCPFLYLQITLGSILNGLDKQLITFRNNIIGLGVRIIFIYTLIPKWGLNGYLWGLLASYLIVSALDAFYLIKAVSISFDTITYIIKPIIVCGAALSLVDFLNRLYNLPFNYTINTFIQVIIYFITLLSLLIITNCITFNELKRLK